MPKTKNPYANNDGTPMDGKEPEFFQWERERTEAAAAKLPDDERKKVELAERKLAKRMDS